jgi:hypothetical protein
LAGPVRAHSGLPVSFIGNFRKNFSIFGKIFYYAKNDKNAMPDDGEELMPSWPCRKWIDLKEGPPMPVIAQGANNCNT